MSEAKALLSELEDPFWTMVFLAATTGLRVSELLGLKWHDISFDTLEIHLSRAIVNGVVGDVKTEAARTAKGCSACCCACWYRQTHRLAHV